MSGRADASMDFTQLLAVGSRVMNKLPQDASAVAIDNRTGARSFVVADGVSEARAAPGVVRRFAAMTASVLSKQLVANATRMAAALLPPPGVATDQRHTGGAEAARRYVRRTLAANLANSPGRSLAGASCVAGGLLVVPQAGVMVVFALGNIATLVTIRTRAEPPGDWVIALNGTQEHQLASEDDGARIEAAIDARVLVVPEGAVEVMVLSDGAHVPGQVGFFAGPREALQALPEHHSALREWALRAATHLAQEGPDCTWDMMAENPADDATVMTASWDPSSALP